MPKILRPDWLPTYQHHKTSGRAKVVINGQTIWLGKHGSPESIAAYDRVVADWKDGLKVKGKRPRPIAAHRGMTITEIIALYWAAKEDDPNFAKSYARQAVKRLRRECGAMVASEFTPRDLRDFRDSLAKVRSLPGVKAEGEKRTIRKQPRALSRRYINRLIVEVRTLYKWASFEGFVPAETWHALQTLPGLAYGRGGSERPDVQPVDDATVEATLPHLPATVAAMVRTLRLTAMRPGELCGLTKDEVVTKGEIWIYAPAKHKSAHKGKARVVAIGKQAQAVLAPYLLKAAPGCPVFSPAASEAQRRAEQHEARETPMSCGNKPGSNVKANPKRQVGDRYTSSSLARTVRRACEENDIPVWSPYMLRHAMATEIRDRFGLEAVAAVLGHADVETSKIYAKLNTALAAKVAAEVG